MSLGLIILAITSGLADTLPDLDLPQRLVGEVFSTRDGRAGSARDPEFATAVSVGEMIVSDDGKTLHAPFNGIDLAYWINPPERMWRENVFTDLSRRPPWSFTVATDSQFGLTFGRGTSLRGALMNWLPVACRDDFSLLCFISHKTTGAQPREGSRVRMVYGFAEIHFHDRGRPNPSFTLPPENFPHYRVLNVTVQAEGARALVARFPNGDLWNGRLEHYQLTRSGIARLGTSGLSAAERSIDGAALRCFISKAKESLYPLSPMQYDAGHRRVLLLGQESFAYDLDNRRMIRLDPPTPNPAKRAYWGIRLVGDRVFYSNWGAPKDGERLFVEEGSRNWKYLGPYRLIGWSANNKYIVLSHSDPANPDSPKVYVVELTKQAVGSPT